MYILWLFYNTDQPKAHVTRSYKTEKGAHKAASKQSEKPWVNEAVIVLDGRTQAIYRKGKLIRTVK